MTDENNEKIFEGDIIETEYGKSTVVFNNRRGFGGFADRKNSYGRLTFLCGCDLKYGVVIGNIYDNPELLEVEKNV